MCSGENDIDMDEVRNALLIEVQYNGVCEVFIFRVCDITCCAIIGTTVTGCLGQAVITKYGLGRNAAACGHH